MSGSDPDLRVFPGARLRRGRSTRLVNGLVFALVAVIVAAMFAVPALGTALGVFGALIALPLALAMLQLRDNSPRGGGRVEVGEDGVHVEGRLVLPRETLVRAVVARDGRGPIVSIQRRQGFTALLDVQTEAEGKALVEALGLAPSQALSDFTFDSRAAAALPALFFPAYLLALFPAIFAPIMYGAAWLSLLLGGAWFAGLLALALPAKLTVGLDGLSLRWAGNREIIHFSSLRGVARERDRLVLALHDGRARSLSVRWMGDRFSKSGVTAAGFPSRAAYLDAVVSRIREAMDQSRRAAAPLPAGALLRGDRDVGAWIRGLRALLDRGAPGFRAAETVPETLWSTVEDGGADPADRAAAAIALTPALDDGDRDRLRGVARVVVSPRLRVALEAAADDDDAAVAEALAELEAGRARKRSS